MNSGVQGLRFFKIYTKNKDNTMKTVKTFESFINEAIDLDAVRAYLEDSWSMEVDTQDKKEVVLDHPDLGVNFHIDIKGNVEVYSTYDTYTTKIKKISDLDDVVRDFEAWYEEQMDQDDY